MRGLSVLAVAAVAGAAAAPAGANDLLDTYRLAQQQDQTFQAALHQRDSAIEARPQALAALLPQVQVQGTVEHDRLHVLGQGQSAGGAALPAEYYASHSFGASFAQTLFDWTAFETLAQSSRQVAEAEAQFRSAEQSLALRTVQAYFGVLGARDTLRADLDAQAAFKEQMDQAQSKYQIGLAAITDVRNAQAAYDTSSATVIADRTALNNAGRALGVLVGKPVDRVAVLTDDIPLNGPEPAAVDRWSAKAGQDNPDLMAANYAAEVQRKQADAVRGKFLPTLQMTESVARAKSGSSFGSDANSLQAGLNANWNLYQGGLVASQLRQAQASYLQAQAQYELQRRMVDQSTRNDFEGVTSGIASVKANRQAVISNQVNVDATEVGLKVGTRSEVDVVNARQALALAQKAYYQSRYAYLLSVVSLKLDAGQLGEGDIAAIDRLLAAQLSRADEPGPAALLADTVAASASLNAELAAVPAAALPPGVQAPAAAAPAALQALQDWALAWSAKDAAAYLSFYAAGFRPEGGLDRAGWEAQRRRRLAQAGQIEVRIVDPQLSRIDEHRVRIAFTQVYRIDGRSQRTRKLVELGDAAGRWQILRERAQ